MITLFVSSKCPDCPPAIKAFEESNLDYEIVDITESMPNLKRFFKYRDFDPFFDQIKNEGRVGVPMIMIGDGEKFIDYEEGMDITFLEDEE